MSDVSVNAPTHADPPRVKYFDLGSAPRQLASLRYVDYLLAFVAGPFWITSIGLIVFAGTILDFWDSGFIMYGLCLLIGYRNFGVIAPSNWYDYAILLPAAFLVFLWLIVVLISDKNLPEGKAFLVYGHFALLIATLLGAIIALGLIATRIGPRKERLVTLLQRIDAQGALPPAGGKAPMIDRQKGLRFIALGVSLFVTAIISDKALPNFLTTLVGAFGFAALLRSRHYFQTSANALLSVDQRQPVLLLRSFTDDEYDQFNKANWQLFDYSIETRLRNYFQRFGPFIAVASPAEAIPQIGAARAVLGDTEWQDVVGEWIQNSSIIIMLAGRTEWIAWELKKIIDGRHLEKLLLLLPPGASRRRGRRQAEIAGRLDHIQHAFSETAWGDAVASIERPESVRALRFDPLGALIVIRNGNSSRDAYHLAALAAHDLTERKQAVQAAPARSRVQLWVRLVVVFGAIVCLLSVGVRFASIL